MQRPLQLGWTRGEPIEEIITREWLVTNGIGGYASGSIGGACTRRFHGLLIAALPTPLARSMMFNHLEEAITLPDGRTWSLSADEIAGGRAIDYPDAGFLEQFALEGGTPVWRWSKDDVRIEKRIVMPHLQNTTYVIYRLLDGPDGIELVLRPALHFRPHEGLLSNPVSPRWSVEQKEGGIEICDHREYPTLRIALLGDGARLEQHESVHDHVLYRIEQSRGYEHEGQLWSPGVLRIPMARGKNCGFIASVETWEVALALAVDEAFEAECTRRARLLEIAKSPHDDFATQLVLAADQFLIHPHTRVIDEMRAYAAGESPRTVIAGYHWFTDWGRDTMISLEGLMLVTGRNREAGRVLRTFASYIRNGLIPNLFPEGKQKGLYHTADATMWFFHALYRYVNATNDRDTLAAILPKLVEIIDCHIEGTDFNIHVDPNDGLLTQGAEGYQLTWMDAKVDDWVVTPRRGKAVEINALYYNALRIAEQFLRNAGDEKTAKRFDEYAVRARKSFNERFWYDNGQYLYDVVDADAVDRNDASLRPNQIFSIALDFPVLDESRWKRVFEVVSGELLTPFGLRTLARSSPDYKKAYDGDLRSRDAAYHQGTVWAWLIGPFIDAWLKVHPGDYETALHFLDGFRPHLGDACIGTISEVFDAEVPYTPRGCVAQAWSVAEVLRCYGKVTELNPSSGLRPRSPREREEGPREIPRPA